MTKNYLLVWLDKDLKEMHTKVGSYEILKECSERLKKDRNILLVDLYENIESIKNDVGKFFLNKHKNRG